MANPSALKTMSKKTLSRVKRLASGRELEKLEVVRILTSSKQEVPDEAVDILVRLGAPHQPKSVRMALASALAEGYLPSDVHMMVLIALENDPSVEVRTQLERARKKSEPLRSYATLVLKSYGKSISDFSAELAKHAKLTE